jgi:hypothetical protein
MDFTLGTGDRARTFRNRVAALQHIADTVSHAGHKQPVHRQYMPTNGRDGGYGSWYHNYQRHMTFDQYKQLAPVAQRVSSLRHFLTEVDAGWREVPGSRASYMDNSVEVTERDRHGNTRTRMVTPPSGDLC